MFALRQGFRRSSEVCAGLAGFPARFYIRIVAQEIAEVTSMRMSTEAFDCVFSQVRGLQMRTSAFKHLRKSFCIRIADVQLLYYMSGLPSIARYVNFCAIPGRRRGAVSTDTGSAGSTDQPDLLSSAGLSTASMGGVGSLAAAQYPGIPSREGFAQQ
jgi:hypothetical protein